MRLLLSTFFSLYSFGFAASPIFSQPCGENLDCRRQRLITNEGSELANAERSNNTYRSKSIRSKYKALNRLLGEHKPNVAYHPLELEAVGKVFEKFGELEIEPNDIPDSPDIEWKTIKVDTPWAGYWYPNYDNVLYRDESSVLAKLDRILAKRGISSQAQQDEAIRLGGKIWSSWEGLCNALSLASTLTPEPKKSITVEGETLEITDQKALLTKMHERYEVDVFGVRYDGGYESDGTYQDIRPEAFHKVIMEFLANRKKPLIIDDAADKEVWQSPVFQIDWLMTEDKTIPYSYFVDSRIWKIKQRWTSNNVLTAREDYIYRPLQYRLYIDPEIYEKEGRRVVIAGEWIGLSRKEHPDFIVIPREDVRLSSMNSSINNNIEVVKEILRLK